MNQPSDGGGSSPQPTPIPLVVYRELRIGMVVIMAMLGVAVIFDWIPATHWQMALSEYFYTSAHGVFIGALLALTTLLFIYKGRSDTEDAFLTLVGVCTFTAALVPQGSPKVWPQKGLPEDYIIENFVLPNVGAVVVALVLGWSLALLQYRLTHSQQTRSPGGRLALYFLRLVVAVGVIALVVAWLVPPFRKPFILYAHGAAGTLMILSFIVTVLCAADIAGREQESESTHPHRYRTIYRVIAGLMLVTLIAVVILHFVLKDNWRYWILALESFLILEFAAYWVVQSIELWDSPDPRERLPEDARPRPVERGKRRLGGLRDEVAQARKDGRSWL